jgi:hypothetical protein
MLSIATLQLGSAMVFSSLPSLIHVSSFFYFWARQPSYATVSPFYFFVGASAFYCYTAYIFSYFFDITYIVGVDIQFLSESLSLINLYFGTLLLCIMVFQQKINHITSFIQQNTIKSTEQNSGKIGALINIILILIYFILFFQNGGMNFVGDFTVSRSIAAEILETGKIWLLEYVILGTSISVLYQSSKSYSAYKRIPSIFVISSLFTSSSYFILQLSLGNRRELIAFLLALFACRSLAGTRFSSKSLFLGLSFFLFSLGFVAVFRDRTSSGDSLITAANALGEFIYPWFTFQYEVQSAAPPSGDPIWITAAFRFMSSLAGGVPYLSGAQLFAMEVGYASDYSMGYAYTPLTEAYRALGVTGAILAGPTILLTLFFAMKLPGKSAFFVILTALALDMNRSEFFSSALQFAIVNFGFYLAMVRIPRIR